MALRILKAHVCVCMCFVSNTFLWHCRVTVFSWNMILIKFYTTSHVFNETCWTNPWFMIKTPPKQQALAEVVFGLAENRASPKLDVGPLFTRRSLNGMLIDEVVLGFWGAFDLAQDRCYYSEIETTPRFFL